jgi:DNA-binding transcriptional LysR family regulator
MIDINYLRYFYFLIVHNGFTKAANQLHVQQPVISRAVKLLEQQLGFKLVERQKKQVLLTPEGREVFRMAEQMFSHAEKIATYAKERKEGSTGEVCFATSDSLAPEIMGPVLKEFINLYPKSKPIHHAGPASMFLEKISAGAIEFGIFFNVPVLSPDLEKSKLTNARFEFVLAEKLAKDKKTLNAFIGSREQGEDESARLPLFEKYKAHQKGVSIVAVSSSSTARRALALNGVGVTILPYFLIREELKKRTLKIIHEGHFSMPVYLVERKSSYRSKSKNELLKLIKEAVEGAR